MVIEPTRIDSSALPGGPISKEKKSLARYSGKFKANLLSLVSLSLIKVFSRIIYLLFLYS